ncbi:MAG: hypothetical protein J7K66_05285, partial [Anaerolineaceae bacterium]|nr:hypothetical protein [Anaerolineaceae bacterium]
NYLSLRTCVAGAAIFFFPANLSLQAKRGNLPPNYLSLRTCVAGAAIFFFPANLSLRAKRGNLLLYWLQKLRYLLFLFNPVPTHDLICLIEYLE